MTDRLRVNKWMVLVISSLVVMLEFGLVFVFSAVFVAVLERFAENRSSVATLMSLLLGVTLSFGVISGILITKFGIVVVTFIASVLVPLGFCSSFFAPNITFLYISIGIIGGPGISMVHISCMVVVGSVFTGSQRHLCLTLVNTANGIGSLAYPYFIEWLLTLYGIHGTFLVLGGISCNSFAFFMLCLINSDELKRITDNTASSKCSSLNNETICNIFTNGLQYVKVLLNKSYLLLLVASTLSIASMNGFIGLILDITIWKGFTTSQALLCYVFNGVLDIAGLLIPGILKQKKGMNSFTILIVTSLAGCRGQLILHFSTSYEVYLIGISLRGFAVGGTISSGVNVVQKLVKEEHVPVAIGLFFTMSGLLSIATGPVFGTMRDMFGSYTGVFMTVGASNLVAAILYTVVLLIRRRESLIRDVTVDNMTSTHSSIMTTPVSTVLTHCNLNAVMSELMKTAHVETRRSLFTFFNKDNRWKKKALAVVPIRFGLSTMYSMFSVTVSVYGKDGSVSVSHGGVEMGQGINTKVAQVVAYELGVPLDTIAIKTTNTTTSANNNTTGGSVTSGECCKGAIHCCQELVAIMKPVKDKMVNPTWQELVNKCYLENVVLTSKFSVAGVPYDQGGKAFDYYAYGATCSEVELDVLTGEYQVNRSDIVYDCGESLNPAVDIGQVEGSFVMGAGYSMTEEIVYDPKTGHMLHNDTWGYHPPTNKDVPVDFRVSLLKNAPNPSGVLRSKASGEPALNTACSIFFALRNCVEEARKDAGQTGEFDFQPPATIAKVQQACLVDPSQFAM